MKKTILTIFAMFLLFISLVIAEYDVISDLSATDTADWWGSTLILDVHVADSNSIYISGENGTFGVYNPETNVTTDLMGADTGNWIASSDIYAITSVDNEIIYLGINNGKFGRYNASSGVLTDLSTTDVGNWIGSNGHIYDISALNRTAVYVIESSGTFGVYNIETNVLSDLSSTDINNWMESTDIMYTIEAINGSSVYLGGDELFGVYNPETNIATNLTPDWLGSSNVNTITALNNSAIYIGASIGKFGVYYPDTNTSTDLSDTDTGNWIGGFKTDDMDTMGNSLIFLGVNNGRFGFYNSSSNTATSLSDKDTGDWMGTSQLVGVSVDEENLKVYIGVWAGEWGIYDFLPVIPVPEIILSPQNNETGVDNDANLVMTFTENVQAGTGNLNIYRYSDDAFYQGINIAGGQVTFNDNEITINPSGTFWWEEKYYVLIDSGVIINGSSYNFSGFSNKDDWAFTIEFTIEITGNVIANDPVFSATNYLVSVAMIISVLIIILLGAYDNMKNIRKGKRGLIE